jgi:hypothetical protein
MNNIETYCKWAEMGREIRIRTDVTESLYNRVKQVAKRFDVRLFVDRTGFLILPSIKQA